MGTDKSAQILAIIMRYNPARAYQLVLDLTPWNQRSPVSRIRAAIPNSFVNQSEHTGTYHRRHKFNTSKTELFFSSLLFSECFFSCALWLALIGEWPPMLSWAKLFHHCGLGSIFHLCTSGKNIFLKLWAFLLKAYDGFLQLSGSNSSSLGNKRLFWIGPLPTAFTWPLSTSLSTLQACALHSMLDGTPNISPQKSC